MVYLLRRACSEGYLEHLRLVNALWLEPDLWLLSLRPGAPDWSRRTRERGDNSVRFAPWLLRPPLVRRLDGAHRRGAAVRSGSAWVASIESGKAELSKPPPGFVTNKNAVVVLGGRAYAMVPYGAAGTIDIVELGGRTCASLLEVSAADRFSIGKDGTLISLAGLNGGHSDCTATYYPKALE